MKITSTIKDIFIIPVGKRYILYAPLKRKVALVDSNLLAAIKNKIDISDITKILKAKDIDLFKIEHDINPSGTVPSDIVLLPTSDCNLRCRYCYSSGGETKKYLPWDAAKAAIDISIRNFVKNKKSHYHLGFLGSGEPTLNWDVFTKSVEYARKKANAEKVSFAVSTVTNGILSEEKAEWLAKNLDTIALSFDGPAEIQNYNRPLANGGNSYEIIYRTAKIFDKNKAAKWVVRATVTAKFVSRLPEIVRFFTNTFECLRRISFEPVILAGRCKDESCPAPSQEDFLKYFIEARKIGRVHNVNVMFSAANPQKLSVRFCGTSGRYFGVNPDCSITACNEVDDMGKEFADTFIYGKFNKDRNSFDINMKKVEKLRKRNLSHMKGCEGCFAKYQCCGGCPVRALRATGDMFKPYLGRCNVVREILKEELFYLVSNKKELVNDVSEENLINEEAC